MTAGIRRRSLLRSVSPPAGMVVLAASLGLSALSIALARALSYDAWGWLLWGQEFLHSGRFTTNGYPTWKPLTGLISALVAPLGDAAPLIWLTIARASAMMALWLAYRLASRVAGRAAGALAVVALLLVPQWLFQTGVGGSEPLVTALLLGAVARHSDRDHLGGFLLVGLAALLRPESWPLLMASAIPAWRRSPWSRVIVAASLVAVPVLWFGGEYLGSGDPFRGSQLAKTTHEAVRLRKMWALPGAGVIDTAWRMLPLPLLVCVPAALVRAFRHRDPTVLALGLGALVWLAEVAVLAQLGYAGVTRFLFPAAAGLAVVGAAGLVHLLRGAPVTRRSRLVLVAIAAALTVPSLSHVVGLGHGVQQVEERADLGNAVDAIVRRMGSDSLIAAPHLAAQGETITPLAWRLDVRAKTLGTPRFPGLALTDTHQRWPVFRRAIRRIDGRFRLRTVTTEWALRLISVEPRSSPSHARLAR